MSVYEDVKKALQELLTPELNTLRERVDQNEQRAQERHQTIMREINWRFDSLKESLELRQKIEEIDRRTKAITRKRVS